MRPGPAASLVACLAVVAALDAAAGCRNQVLPGDDYGRYQITGHATLNSCGPGLGSPDPWVFDAELSRQGSKVYWSWLDNGPPISGLLTTPTHATITATENANVDPTDAGLGPCTLTRSDDLELVLPATGSPSSFSGTISYSFAVPGGSTCGDQLASEGGTYAALPCSVSYSFTATRP